MVRDFKESCIFFVVPAEYRLNALLEKAAELHGISKSEYMRKAIDARLDADGVTLDSLPPE